MRGRLHNAGMMTHTQRVALYRRIIADKRVQLTEFTVALMRNAAPNQAAMDALNEALRELGYQR